MAAPERGALLYPGFTDVIDVSSAQGTAIDWARVKQAGFGAVVVKVAEGATGRDPMALRYLAGARAAGLYTLAYLFVRFNQDPDQQVENLWTAMGDTMPYRFVLDDEIAPVGMSPTSVVDLMRRSADDVQEFAGRPPVIYTARFFTTPLGNALAKASDLARCPLWVAQYLSTVIPWVPPPKFQPTIMAPWTTWTMHQYSGDGGFRVPGIATDCDRSLFNGDEEQFRRFLGLPDTEGDSLIPIIHPTIDFDELADDDDDETPPAA